MCWDIWKVIQSLQLLLFHQIKFYSRVIALCGLSYTCFIGNQLLLQFGETGLKTRKTCAQESWKVIQSLQHLASHQMRPYSSVISLCGLSCTCFPGFTVLGQFRELHPNTLYHVQGHAKSNPKTSAPYFTLNETLL